MADELSADELRRRRLARLAPETANNASAADVGTETTPVVEVETASPSQVAAGLDGKASPPTGTANNCTHEKNESEVKSEFPDLSPTASPLNKRLKNSTESFGQIEQMDVTRSPIVKCVNGVDMDWESDSRRDSAKRQKASPDVRCSLQATEDLFQPLFSRIFPAFDAPALPPQDQISDSDKVCLYMNRVSAYLSDLLVNIFSSDFSESVQRLNLANDCQDFCDRSKSAVLDAISCRKDKIGLALFSLMQSYESIDQVTRDVKAGAPNIPLVDALIDARSQCISQAVLILTNIFASDEQLCQTSSLLPFVLNFWHRDFITELLTSSYNEDGTAGDFRLIFQPLLLALWQEMYSCASFCKPYARPLQALNELCDITIGVKRPICQLIVEMDYWIPSVATNAQGRELTTLSFLAPFFRLSVFAEDDSKIVDEFYGTAKLSADSIKIVNQRLQGLLAAAREEMFGILHHIIRNTGSRDQALRFLSEVMVKNEKRSQFQVDEKLVATDGFMLNMAFVLQKLSLKIRPEKVDLQYPFYSDALIKMRKQETRLKMVCNEAEAWATGMTCPENVNFQTQCFFLTLECHHLSLIPCMRKYTRRVRAIRDYSRVADELHQSSHNASHNQATIRRWREHAQRLAKAKTCADAGLLDQQLLSNSLRFYCLHMSVLLKCLGSFDPEDSALVTLPPANAVNHIFSAYPEWFVEDVAEFLLFTIQNVPQVIDCEPSNELVHFLVVLICTCGSVSNPYLVAKLIEVIFNSCPLVNSSTHRFNARLLNHQLAKTHLAKALMKFYTDVESTGASSEFYDKFTIRYHISVIFKTMWSLPVYQLAIVDESRDGEQFVRFINMLINDTTFLLDESLESLKRIHEVQEAMDRSDPSNNASSEQQNRQRQLASDERQCRSYLTLATETVDMFHYLTAIITTPFFRPELVDRLAAMLNFNLGQLCGSKCNDLKVKNSASYGWNPKQLLTRIVSIYLHLDSDEFARAIASDERSYSKQLFQELAVSRLRKIPSIWDQEQSRWRDMCDRIEGMKALNAEVDFADIPDEYTDALMGTLMQDPVILPSSHVVDRSVIVRHLLNSATDPFSRQPLQMDQLVPDHELKKRIDEWKASKVRQLNNAKNGEDGQ